jgi:hypothetical protein
MISSVAHFDARPFFEKALTFGIQQGLINQNKLDQICADAPKGIVQIARYFGSEFLRPELEKARDRMVNLISLHLEHSCAGDLQKAAESLRDHSLLSRSKAGSEMLKTLLSMPQNSHFGMQSDELTQAEQAILLGKWSMRSLKDYQDELSSRTQAKIRIDTALWFAQQLNLDVSELEDASCEAEAIIRTALLASACKRKEMPDWVNFEKLIQTFRKKYKGDVQSASLALILPKDLPPAFESTVIAMRDTVIADLSKILDPLEPPRKLFELTPAFIGRYHWIEDSLQFTDNYVRTTSAKWDKTTQGHDDEGSLLTLFLCIASRSTAKTLLTEKAAASIVRKIRKSGLHPQLVSEFIQEHAPQAHVRDYTNLWNAFITDASSTLLSDMDYELTDALALLRCECNIKD